MSAPVKLTEHQHALLTRVVKSESGPLKGLPYAHIGSRRPHFAVARELVALGLLAGERWLIMPTDAGRAALEGAKS